MQVNPRAKTLKLSSFFEVDCIGAELYNKLKKRLERGKSMQKFTPPKSKQILGEAVVLPAAISADAEFKQAVDTFCEYAAQNGISFTNKDGGITVKKDPTLAKEGFCIHITEGGAEVSVADLKAAHGALSVLLCEIKKEDGGFGIAQTVIKEEPDMFYRGLSVDLARQWHGPEYILKYIDLCYMNRATHLQLQDS